MQDEDEAENESSRVELGRHTLGDLPLLEHQNEVEQETIQEGDQEQDDRIQLKVNPIDTKSLEDVVSSEGALAGGDERTGIVAEAGAVGEGRAGEGDPAEVVADEKVEGVSLLNVRVS